MGGAGSTGGADRQVRATLARLGWPKNSVVFRLVVQRRFSGALCAVVSIARGCTHFWYYWRYIRAMSATLRFRSVQRMYGRDFCSKRLKTSEARTRDKRKAFSSTNTASSTSANGFSNKHSAETSLKSSTRLLTHVDHSCATNALKQRTSFHFGTDLRCSAALWYERARKHEYSLRLHMRYTAYRLTGGPRIRNERRRFHDAKVEYRLKTGTTAGASTIDRLSTA